jgi:CBS domain containing-hemolysin-like protein
MADEGSLSPIVGIPIVVFLLLANALFVATEFALVTVRRTRIDQLVAEGDRSARRVKAALGNLDYYVAASQLGITMASIALGFFGEPVLAAIIEPPVEAVIGAVAPAVAHTIAIAVAFFFVTALHIVVGEFIPKTIALEQSDRTSLLIALPLQLFVRVFGPVIWVLNAIANGLLRLLGQDLRPLGDDPLTAEDLGLAFETSASAGLITRRELGLTRHLLRLSQTESRELMVPRGQMIALDADASWEGVATTFARRPLTRYPAYEGSIDTVVGILDARRLLLNGDDVSRAAWRSQVQPATVLPESATLDVALEAMRRQGSQMAILVDEYGGTAGLLTQFDIVRFLTEDLPEDLAYDDRHVPAWDQSAPLVLSGLVPMSELRAILDAELPESDAVTVGGFVTELRQQIPAVGESVTFDGITATVLEMDQYRVAQVQLEANPTPPATAKLDEIPEPAR